MFTWRKKAGVTKIRSHQTADQRLCKNIRGYDANALYLFTMLCEMPCGQEEVLHYNSWPDTAALLTQRIKNGIWFTLPEVDIAILEHLWPKFEKMCPFFLNKEVPEEAGYQSCRTICSTPADRRSNTEKLVGALSMEKILLYTPLLHWYMDHGAVIKSVPNDGLRAQKSFTWFVEQVTEARRRCQQEQSPAQGGVQVLAEQQVREIDRKLWSTK